MMRADGTRFSLPSGVLANLPVVIVSVLIVAGSLFCALSVIPAWRAYEAQSLDLAAGQESLDARSTQYALQQQEEVMILREQVASARRARDQAAVNFWNDLQVDPILDRLYEYASESGVALTLIQSQQPRANTGETNEVYEVRTFQMQVDGQVPQLMNFVSRLRENTVPSVLIQDFNLSRRDQQSSLRMNLLIYLSPFASGEIFSLLRNLSTPTLIPPTPTPAPPTLTPTPAPPTLTPSPVPPTPTPVPPTATLTPTITPTATITIVPTSVQCPGAPPSRFQAGEIVVVDFNTDTALNVLPRPRTGSESVTVLFQARDGDRLQLVSGPVCGTWEGQNLWYWNANVLGQNGWVGEGTTDSNWLCPEAAPECNG